MTKTPTLIPGNIAQNLTGINDKISAIWTGRDSAHARLGTRRNGIEMGIEMGSIPTINWAHVLNVVLNWVLKFGSSRNPI